MWTFLAGIIVGYFIEKVLDEVLCSFSKIFTKYRQKHRARYEKDISSDDYLQWELKSLKAIYEDCGEFVQVFDKEFPAIAIEGAAYIDYPFKELSPKEHLKCRQTEELDFQKGKYYRAFRSIVSDSIRCPQLYGYANEGILFDKENRIVGFWARPRKYEETVYTCHILQYELWRAYRRLKAKRIATLEDLPMRKAIHKGKTNRQVLFDGCNRSALCDVSVAIVSCDRNNKEYGIAIGKRSSDVATFPGYYSIVPSGGFELYELEENQSDDNIEINFSIISAIFREYLEEVFNKYNTDTATGNNDFERLKNYKEIKELQNGISSGEYKLVFLGAGFDLVTLRVAFSFALRVDDPDYRDNTELFTTNHENISEHSISFNSLKTALHNGIPMMSESAATIYLLLNNKLVEDIL